MQITSEPNTNAPNPDPPIRGPADTVRRPNAAMHNRAIFDAYTRARPVLGAIAQTLDTRLRALLADHGIKVHSVQRRVKTANSLAAKVARPERTYRGLTDVTDLVGLRVIAYFEDTVETIATLLERHLAVDFRQSVDKTAALASTQFGYRSVHYVCALPEDCASRLERPQADGPPHRYEIQIRTVLQHAWAEIEHDLGYKTEADVPAAMRRKFSRLAGLLELVDEEFVSIRRDRERYARKVARSIGAAQAVELDVVSLRSYLERDRARAIDARIAEQLALDLDEEPFYPDYLVRLLQFAGLRTVREVERALDRHAMQVLGAVRPYFDFTRDSFGFDHRSLRQLPRGYGLLLLAHVVVLDGHELELQRREALTRLYTHMDYPDDEAAARRVAHHLIDILEPRRESGDPA